MMLCHQEVEEYIIPWQKPRKQANSRNTNGVYRCEGVECNRASRLRLGCLPTLVGSKEERCSICATVELQSEVLLRVRQIVIIHPEWQDSPAPLINDIICAVNVGGKRTLRMTEVCDALYKEGVLHNQAIGEICKCVRRFKFRENLGKYLQDEHELAEVRLEQQD